MKLQGKVFAVTGGFGALGLVIGAVAAAEGARIALIDRAAAPDVADLPSTLSTALMIGGVDLAELGPAERALAAVEMRFGGLDVLANVAGAFRWQTLSEGDLENWDLLYRVNLRTAAAASKAALPLLRKRGAGRIVNVGAGAAAKAGAGMGAYTAAKAGVGKLTESLAAELKDERINVNAVLPSIIDTPANRADMPAADFSRWVDPHALADVIVFLASDAARAITGALLPVSGRV